MNSQITGFWLSPTYRCNNRCEWCYVGGKLAKKDEASLSDVKRYILQMAEVGAKECIFIGGEPTTYPHIVDAVKFATDNDLNAKIMTNGRKLANRGFAKSLKEAGLKHCSISIEGVESVHDRITRVPGSFKESVAGIRSCQEEEIPVNSISTVGNSNKGTIEDLVRFLAEIGVRRSVFNMCSSQPSGYDGDDTGVIGLDEYARIVEEIGLKYNFVRFYALIPLCLFDQEKLYRLLTLGRMKVSCALFARAVAIDPNGNLNPCTHMADISYGNLRDANGLSDFVETKTKERAFLQSHAPSPKCVSCKLWNTCLGGCNLIWFSRRAESFIKGISS